MQLPDVATQWKEKGNRALADKDYTNAIAYFTEGLKVAPTNAILYSNRAAAYACISDWQASLQDADSAIQHSPEWGKAYTRKALALIQLQRWDQAVAACKQGLQVEPNNEQLQAYLKEAESAVSASEQNALAEEFLSKGKAEQALAVLDRVVELQPNIALFWSNHSNASLLCRKIPQAKTDANKVIWLKPDWHKGYQRMAEALLQERLYDDACVWYAKALQLNTGDPSLMRAFSQAQQENVMEKARRANAAKCQEDDKDKGKDAKDNEKPAEAPKKNIFGF
jgi:tetratricopeptide (TPR) repeat protein